MLGARAGTTLVGLLTVTPDVFDQVAEVRIAPEIHERLVAWRARFGLAIDNALNFLNNPDGIQGHNFSTQVAHVDDRRVLQGRLTLVRYNNEPQFFVADAAVFYSPDRRRPRSARAADRRRDGRPRHAGAHQGRDRGHRAQAGGARPQLGDQRLAVDQARRKKPNRQAGEGRPIDRFELLQRLGIGDADVVGGPEGRFGELGAA